MDSRESEAVRDRQPKKIFLLLGQYDEGDEQQIAGGFSEFGFSGDIGAVGVGDFSSGAQETSGSMVVSLADSGVSDRLLLCLSRRAVSASD